MREIKFRVWDKQFKKFIDLQKNQIVLSHLGLKGIYGGDGYVKEWEASQYTGLKDSKGIDIYEGDILYDYDHEYIGVISFLDGAFIVTWENEFCNAYEWTTEEVIGNIYENPALIYKEEAISDTAT